MPRRANTKPKRASVLAMRMSIGSCIVTPMPTAAPLMAPITGFRLLKMRSVTCRRRRGRRRRPWLLRARVLPRGVVEGLAAGGQVGAGAEGRPAPVTMTARTASSASVASKAAISSSRICAVNAFSFSGRFSVTRGDAVVDGGGVQPDLEAQRAHRVDGLGQRRVQQGFAAAEDHAVEQAHAAAQQVQRRRPVARMGAAPRLQARVVAVAAAPGAALHKHHRHQLAGPVGGGEGFEAADFEGGGRRGGGHAWALQAPAGGLPRPRRQRADRAGCSASMGRSPLCGDAPAMLGLAGSSRNSLRELRSLRSDSRDEIRARGALARAARKPCASRHPIGAPQPARTALCSTVGGAPSARMARLLDLAAGGALWGRFVGRREAQRMGRRAQRAS
jgi:hypothetical protein